MTVNFYSTNTAIASTVVEREALEAAYNVIRDHYYTTKIPTEWARSSTEWFDQMHNGQMNTPWINIHGHVWSPKEFADVMVDNYIAAKFTVNAGVIGNTHWIKVNQHVIIEIVPPVVKADVDNNRYQLRFHQHKVGLDLMRQQQAQLNGINIEARDRVLAKLTQEERNAIGFGDWVHPIVDLNG